MSEPTDLTLYTLQLGAIDATTGWYYTDYSVSSTIQGVIRERGQTLSPTGTGPVAIYANTLFTQDPHAEDDIIKDSFNDYYVVKSRQKIPWLNSLFCYQSELVQRWSDETRPSTSGTWTTVHDARYRTKKYIDDYLTAANIKEDDNATNATTLTAFGLPDYSLNRIFIGKQVDLVFSIGYPDSTAEIDADLKAYGYTEQVPVTLYAIDKSGLTATRVVHAGETELRLILETYPSLAGVVWRRAYGQGRPSPINIGSLTLWSKTVMLEYERSKSA